jgi:hypothetical protein
VTRTISQVAAVATCPIGHTAALNGGDGKMAPSLRRSRNFVPEIAGEGGALT